MPSYEAVSIYSMHPLPTQYAINGPDNAHIGFYCCMCKCIANNSYVLANSVAIRNVSMIHARPSDVTKQKAIRPDLLVVHDFCTYHS